MGIATTTGVIRDFAGPYFVSEDDMAFGKPTKYWQLDPNAVCYSSWDQAVHEASEEYKHHMVYLFFIVGCALLRLFVVIDPEVQQGS